jgi:hypothetical protein
MAGPASTVAFVIARSPARGSRRGRLHQMARLRRTPPGRADTPWRDRNTSGTLPRRRSRRRRFAAPGIPRRSHPPAARPPPGSQATGPESAGPAPPAPQQSFKNSGEVTTRTTASQYRATAGARWQAPPRTVQPSPRCRASRCEIPRRLRGHVEQQRHPVDRGVGAADQHQLPRNQLTAADHGPLGHPEQRWPWRSASQPPAGHVPTAASNAAQSTTTGSRRWAVRHGRAASAAVPPFHWPGYAVKHDLLGGTGTEIRSDKANDT